MSKEIEYFLNKLNNWKETFEIKNYDNKNNNDFLQIVSMQRAKNIEGLISIWEKQLEQDYFELPHPEYPEIITRAVYNIQHGMANFVFMIDKENKYPWVITQCESVINIVITQNNILVITNANHEPVYASIDTLSNINIKYLKYSDVKFGFLLGQTRPYHYFYDHFKYLCEFNKDNKLENCKPIFENKPFFKYPSIKYNNEKKVYLFPGAIGNNYINSSTSPLVKQLNEQMEELVYQDAMKGFEKQNIKLWYGITGQKRSWLEQIDGCVQIVSNLLQHFKIDLIIDGMTATEGEVITNLEDETIYNEIKRKLQGQCNIKSLIGKDYRHKIQICSSIDIFIANAGTGCIVPLRFCKKPGVLHSNSMLITFPDKYPDTVKFNNEKYEVDVYDKNTHRIDFCSYHIPWQHIYNLTAEVLNQIKGTNIKTLDVPTEEIEKLRDKLFKDYVVPENQIIKEFNELKVYDICWKDYHKNNQIKDLSIDPILHYINNWRKMNLIIDDIFDTSYYLEKYQDVKKAKINPLCHYFKHGIKEGRKGIKSE